MPSDRESFMRMMGITADDVADPACEQRKPPHSMSAPRSSVAPFAGGGTTGGTSSPHGAKRRAFLAELGLDEAGMPLGTSSSQPSPPPARAGAAHPAGTASSPLGGNHGAAAGRPATMRAPSSSPSASGGGGAAEKLKAAGNDAFEEGNFLEAIALYTQAIELAVACRADSVFTAVLYSNRSASYLQGAKQLPSVESAYDHAIYDADQAVTLRPDWFKGYARQGDAYFKSMRYHQAAEAYTMALRLQPGNVNLANSLRESRERAKSDSREQWQARRQARKQQQQHTRLSGSGSGSFPHHSSSIASSSPGEPISPASLGYEGGTTATSSLNTTSCSGSPSKNARELWSELKAEVETTAKEQVTGDDYRRQQLEKFRQEREAKSRRLFGATTAIPNTNDLATATGKIAANSSRDSSAAASPSVGGDSRHNCSTPRVTGGGGGGSSSTISGERVGSQLIPDEYSSAAASAYQQRLLEQFRQRKTKA